MEAALSTPNDLGTQVYQHNHLIRTNLRMGELEAKIFVLALSCIYQSADPNEPLPPIKIKITDVVSTPSGPTYELLRKACKDLFDQELHLVSTKSKSRKADYWSRIVTDIGIDEGTGFITGYFNPRIRPFLQGLKATAESEETGFTMAYLAVLLTLQNPHAQRMYWILKSWQKVGVKEYTVEQLKLFLFEIGALDKGGKQKEVKDPYPNWADFARFVLKPVEKELAKIDFPVTITPIKTGKKTTAVRFTLPPITAKPQPIQAALPFGQQTLPQSTAPTATDSLPAAFGQLYTALARVWQLSSSQIESVKAAVGANETKLGKVKDVMRVLNAEKAGIDNLPAVLWTRLKKEFPVLAAGK
jgi:hypothetical protein